MVRKVKRKNPGIRVLVALLLIVGAAAFVCKSGFTPAPHPLAEAETAEKTSAYAAVTITATAFDNRTTAIPLSWLTPDPPDDRPTLVAPLWITPGASDDGTTPLPPATITTASSAAIAFDQLNSPYAILIRLDDQTVLMQKNSEARIYPASLSKIMTAIVAIENLPDLQAEIELTEATFQGLYAAEASLAGFQPGEQVRAIDLLYGLMLPSGAECGVGLAEQIAGSEQNFVKLMNQKAAELGMDQTHFENASGLHHENHYTTVKDLATLLSYALQNATFREIFTSASYSTSPTNLHPGGITFYSTMFAELNHQYLVDGEILGGKTGYTEEAGLCLASLARVGEQEYILITAGAEGDHDSEQYNITDAFAVYNRLGT